MIVKLDKDNVIVSIDIPLSKEHKEAILKADTTKIEIETNIEPIELVGKYKLNDRKLEKIAEQIDICALKEKKIQESKEQLAVWLANNPMESEIHDPKGAHYTVTQEKQSQLTQLLTLYSMAKQAGTEMQLTWNSTGGICEEWTYDQLSTLSFQIAGYVLPRVKKQQKYEVRINGSTTIEEVNAIEIEYDTI